MQPIVKIRFGSHLYGTNNQNSDTDYKGIFIPDYREILLGKISHNDNQSTGSNNSKNTKDDVDTEWISIHKFIKDAISGQTYAFDMLHAPENMCERTIYSGLWDEIVDNREKFYSKNIHAFVGYAKGQAAKYSKVSSRLNTIKNIISILEREKLKCHQN